MTEHRGVIPLTRTYAGNIAIYQFVSRPENGCVFFFIVYCNENKIEIFIMFTNLVFLFVNISNIFFEIFRVFKSY